MLTHSQAANVISIIQNDVLQQVNTTTFWPKGKHATHCNTLTGRRLTDTHTHTHAYSHRWCCSDCHCVTARINCRVIIVIISILVKNTCTAQYHKSKQHKSVTHLGESCCSYLIIWSVTVFCNNKNHEKK